MWLATPPARARPDRRDLGIDLGAGRGRRRPSAGRDAPGAWLEHCPLLIAAWSSRSAAPISRATSPRAAEPLNALNLNILNLRFLLLGFAAARHARAR